MQPALPTDWLSRGRVHPGDDLVACSAGAHRDRRGVGIWRRDGAPVAWLARALDLAWLADAPAAIVVFEQGHRSEPPLPLTQIVARIHAPTWEIAGELSIGVDPTGCAIEEIVASPSGRWAATRRSSGQGESGFDVIDVARMERIGGVARRRGIMLAAPVFAPDEARVLTGIGPWLGGWWAHPEDELEDPARGGVIDFGCLLELDLDARVLHTCALELEIPAGWVPSDPWADEWMGPTSIEPLERGARVVLPGGDCFAHAAPLPAVLRLPQLAAFGHTRRA